MQHEQLDTNGVGTSYYSSKRFAAKAKAAVELYSARVEQSSPAQKRKPYTQYLRELDVVLALGRVVGVRTALPPGHVERD